MTRLNFMPIIIFAVSLFLFLFNIQHQEVIGFESRFYLFALEMWQRGLSWFPTTYFEPYPDYPGASVWLMYLSACVFGGVSKFSAVFPSAAAAALTCVITYQTGMLREARFAIASVMMMFLTLTFLKCARTVSIDVYPALFTAMSFYLAYSSDVLKQSSRRVWIYPMLLLSFLFRGPIGLVMPTGVVCIYDLINKKYKSFFITGLIAAMILLLATTGLLAIAYHVGGDSFMRDVLRMQVAGRIDNYYQPIYFYFIDSFGNYALSYPIALFVMLDLFFRKSSRHERLLLLGLTGWVLVILIGMSIPGDKKIRYVLPMVPALALLSAYVITTTTNTWVGHFVKKFLAVLFAIFPLICFLTLWWVHRFVQEKMMAISIEHAGLSALLIFMQALNVFYYFSKNKQSLSLLFVAATSFYITYLGAIEPIDIYLNRAARFVEQVEIERLNAHAALVFYKERPDGLAIKYRINMPVLSQPLFIEDEAGLLKITTPAYFVTSEEVYYAMPKNLAKRFKLVGQERMGHAPIVVFTNR